MTPLGGGVVTPDPVRWLYVWRGFQFGPVCCRTTGMRVIPPLQLDFLNYLTSCMLAREFNFTGVQRLRQQAGNDAQSAAAVLAHGNRASRPSSSFQPPAHLLRPKTPSGECAWRRLRSKGPPMRAPDRTIVILRIIRLIYGARTL